MNRREFLKAMGRAGIAIPGLLAGSSCAPALTKSDPSTGLSLGYIAGDVSGDSALVWLRAGGHSRRFEHRIIPRLRDRRCFGG